METDKHHSARACFAAAVAGFARMERHPWLDRIGRWLQEDLPSFIGGRLNLPGPGLSVLQ